MVDSSLPSNDKLVNFSSKINWRQIEQNKRQFNLTIQAIAEEGVNEPINLDTISDIVGVPIKTLYDTDDANAANVLIAEEDGLHYILGSVVSARYRSGKTLAASIVPYHLNPSVNHTNLHETDEPSTRMRALGAEIELGLVHGDGASPSEEEMLRYIHLYHEHAERMGIYPRLDREACQYQIEAHIAPNIGYEKTRQALEGIMATLVAASEDTGLRATILPAYPTASDFKTADYAKVKTAVDLMHEVNSFFPMYTERLNAARKRYYIEEEIDWVHMFRCQGCHIHIDLAGRSEALGLFTFYTMLHSASAIANAAVLKGGPFVNGTCDPELLCTREYLRSTTATGRYLGSPISPHFSDGGLHEYGELLRLERANAVGRAMLYDGSLDTPISVMHNPIGRLRPDLGNPRRICTVESTGMPANISASRMAAVLADMEFSQAIMEAYFREHGCDLEPMYDNRAMWAVLGPLNYESFTEQHDESDRLCTDIAVKTAAGTQMSLAAFYDMKRRFVHKALANITRVTPREIDEVYTSLIRMMEPPSGQQAQTIQHFIADPKLRSTGNWGLILRNAYIEAGGVPGKQNPEAVLEVVNQIHDAMRTRYLEHAVLP